LIRDEADAIIEGVRQITVISKAAEYQGSLKMTLGIRVSFCARPPRHPRARCQKTSDRAAAMMG
jgi:hypothetical protein